MNAQTFPVYLIISLCRWQGHHSHFPPVAVTCWLPADLPQHLKHWLYDCRIAISVSKNTVVLFVRTAKNIWELQLAQVFGQPVHRFCTAHNVGGDCWCTAEVYGLYKSGWEGGSTEAGHAGPLP